jgi:hypothetical protein
MFRALLNDVKSATGSLIAKYVMRVSVAVPFLVALGFATAAITLMLVERYGAVAAYWMIAAAFTVIGLVAATVVSMREQDEAIAEAEAEKTDSREVASSAMAQAANQAPLALLGAILSSPLGPNALSGGAKLALRNIPLVVLVALVSLLLWPTDSSGEQRVPADASGDDKTREPVPVAPMPNGFHKEAA